MFKVLIADDEPDICELIVRLIDWEKLDLVLVGIAQHGLEAEHMIEIQKPDIVITDIQMPGMTGLELIEKYSEDITPSFIVISGYREFEHAQRALRFGAEDYLLKPIRKEDLNFALQHLVERFQKINVQREDQELMHETLGLRTMNLRTKDFLQFILSAAFSLSTGGSLDNSLFSFKKGHFVCVGFHVSFSILKDIDETVRQTILENLNSRLREHMKTYVADMETAIHGPNAFCLLNYTDEGETLKKCLNIVSTIQREATVQYEGVRIAAAIGTEVNDLTMLGRAVYTAYACLGFRLVYGCDQVMQYPDGDPVLREVQLDEKERQEIDRTINALDIEASNICFHKIYIRLAELPKGNGFGVFSLSRDIMDFIYRAVWNTGIELHDIIRRTETRLENCVSIPELEHTLCQYAAEIISAILEQRQSQDAAPIRKAKEYIQIHYQEQISLEDVARLSFLSPTYFSTLFREHTGETFSNYVIRIRMEAAKEMLKNQAYSIAEIASRVGYADARHFSKTFQMVVGVKPTAYRKFYS